MDGPFIQILSCYLYTWFCKIPKFHGFLNFKNCKQLWSVENSWDHDRLQFTLPYFFFIFHFSRQRRPVWKRRLLIIWTSCPCFYSWRILRMEFGQSLRWLSLGLLCQPRRRHLELSLGRTGWVTIKGQVLWVKILSWAILQGLKS